MSDITRNEDISDIKDAGYQQDSFLLELDGDRSTKIVSDIKQVAESNVTNVNSSSKNNKLDANKVKKSGNSNKNPNGQIHELDIELKIKFKKILWSMGNYGRMDVKLAQYGEPTIQGRQDGIGELTDIDVLGFTIQDDFQINNIIVDCKNGENISPSNRLFWIKGLMDNLGDSRGYLVMGKKVIPPQLRDIANKFNVALMDSKNIISMERIYDIDNLDNIEVFSKDAFYAQEKINDKTIQELLNYRKYNYWIDDDHTKIHNIMNLLSKYSKKLSPNNKNHQIVVMDFSILLTMVLFKLCSFIVKTSISEVRSGVISFLYDGIYNLNKYKSVLELVDKIFKATAKNYDEIRQMIDYKPHFYDSLVELCITILRRPKESKDILRYMDAALYCSIAPKKENRKSIKEIFKSDFNEITNKLMFDIFDFVEENTGISKDIIPRKQIYM